MKKDPPKIATQFLRWYCHEDHLDEIEGNLYELFHKWCEKAPRKARWKYSWQVLLHFRPDFIKSLNAVLITAMMDILANYFKIAWRNLTKSSVFTTIHILGLSIGAAACMLIFQYIHFERSYDQFHEHAADIYRVPIRYSEGFGIFPKTASNHPGLGPALQADFPEVLAFTRLMHPSSWGIIGSASITSTRSDGQRSTFNEEHTYLADSGFFQIFSFPFLAGDQRSSLSEPGSIVISRDMAKKYFGKESVLGEKLEMNGRDLKITGVIENVPENSHMAFDALVSFNTYDIKESWMFPEFYTYVLLRPGTDPGIVEARFPDLTDRYMAAIHKEHNFQTYFSLQPLLDIHLKSDCANEPTPPGSERMVYFLTLLGVFILVIAWVNYVNLSTSKSLERAKEVGVRKVVGASRNQLTGQFLTEAVLLNALGIIGGVILAKVFLPIFTELVGKQIGDSLLNLTLLAQPVFWAILVGSILLGGFIAGIYPALVLSSFRPVMVLRSGLSSPRNNLSLRKLLVGFQFVLSILLIAVTLLVSRQLRYMSREDLGYNKDQMLVVKAPVVRDSLTGVKANVLINELNQIPGVNSMSRSSEIPGKLIAFRNETRRSNLDKEYNTYTYVQQIDHQYIPAFDIPLVAGRNFIETDSSKIFDATNNKVVINALLAASYGFDDPESAIGEHIKFKLGNPDHDAEIIGVVENYHQRSLKEAYDPLLFYYPSWSNWYYYALNINTTNLNDLVTTLESTYKRIFPDGSMEYFFLDEFFDRQYRADQQFSKVCGVMAALAIFVACLGFFGLSALILIRRTKEIGVRKILGASTSSIMYLISRDFVMMLLSANFIALPLVLYFGGEWLNNFAFNVGLGWQVFILPILILLLIVFTIVSVQVYRTTALDPIKALQSE